MQRALFYPAFVLPFALLSGCEDAAPSAESESEIRTAKSHDVSSTRQSREGTEQSFGYSAVGKRNPFRSVFDQLDDTDRVRRRGPLERFEIDQLSLVAVVVGTASPRAMIEDPSGKGHVVRVGSLVGNNGGQIKAIRRGEVLIHEELRMPHGRYVHPVRLKIPEPSLALLD